MPQTKWLVLRDGKKSQPMVEEDLINLIKAGKIRAGDKVWTDDMDDWVQVSESRNFGHLFLEGKISIASLSRKNVEDTDDQMNSLPVEQSNKNELSKLNLPVSKPTAFLSDGVNPLAFAHPLVWFIGALGGILYVIFLHTPFAIDAIDKKFFCLHYSMAIFLISTFLGSLFLILEVLVRIERNIIEIRKKNRS